MIVFFQIRSVLGNQELKSVFRIVNGRNEDVKIGSILGLLSFNIVINDIHMRNFLDITLYSCRQKLRLIKKNLIFGTKNIFNWFRLRFLKSKL